MPRFSCSYTVLYWFDPSVWSPLHPGSINTFYVGSPFLEDFSFLILMLWLLSGAYHDTYLMSAFVWAACWKASWNVYFLNHFNVGDLTIILKIHVLNALYKTVTWTLTVQMLFGECHKTLLMRSHDQAMSHYIYSRWLNPQIAVHPSMQLKWIQDNGNVFVVMNWIITNPFYNKNDTV